MTGERCRVAVLASGTGSNFKAIAEACRDASFPATVVCLITDNPEAGALGHASALGVPAHTVVPPTKKAGLPAETEQRIADICRRYEADLVVLAGFMRILKGPLLDEFAGRIMNIHPSLLPSFKGLNAVQQALDYGVKVTGCTVHFVDHSIDGGAIILQSTVPIGDDDEPDDVLERVHGVEHKTYVRAVRLFAEGRLRVENRRVLIAREY